jgi:hypothetical protein
MASKAFSALANSVQSSKNLDTILVGSGYLPEGTHDVTIKAVGPATDREGNEVENQSMVTFVGEGDKEHNERLFLINREGTEFGYGVRMLLSGVIPDKALLGQFMDVAGEIGEKALEMFTGMKCRIVLKPGPGFQARSTGDGRFAAFEIGKKGETIGKVEGTEADDIETARDLAKAQGLYRSYLRVAGVTATHAESNAAAFVAAVANRGKSKPATKAPKAV